MNVLVENRRSRIKPFSNIMKSDIIGIVGAVAILSLAMSLLRPQFLTAVNVVVIARGVSITGIVALSQMIVLGSGGMNLSVGAIGGLAGIITGGLMAKADLSPVVAILCGLIVGALCGLLNGWLIVKNDPSGVSSFFITLATSSVFAGLTFGITKANPYYNLPQGFKLIGSTSIGGVPLLVVIMLAVAGILDFGFRFTGFGRQILAIGGNLRAAKLSGVPAERVIIICHALSGFLAGLAAILLVARLGSAQPDMGSDWMLSSVTAPIIGGTRLAGGRVNVAGTVLGTILLAITSNALVHLNVDVYWMTLIRGLIILAAVGVDRIRTIVSDRNVERGRA